MPPPVTILSYIGHAITVCMFLCIDDEARGGFGLALAFPVVFSGVGVAIWSITSIG